MYSGEELRVQTAQLAAWPDERTAVALSFQIEQAQESACRVRRRSVGKGNVIKNFPRCGMFDQIPRRKPGRQIGFRDVFPVATLLERLPVPIQEFVPQFGEDEQQSSRQPPGKPEERCARCV